MANSITGIRIACALSLLFCPTFSKWFYLFYLVGGASDVLDGIAARRLGTESKLGARLDTAADILFTVIVLIKVLRAVSVPLWLCIWIGCIALIKCVNIASGFIRYRRFVSEHTVMNKICGILLFALPLCIDRFAWQVSAMLMIVTCTAATFAAVGEGHYIRTGKEIR